MPVHHDESFELDGYTIYMIVPPREQKELFSQAIELWNKAQEATEVGLSAFDFLIPDHKLLKETGDFVETVYNALIGALVVDWDLTRGNGEAVPCNEETKKGLTMTAKRKISEKIIEILRLWTMAM